MKEPAPDRTAALLLPTETTTEVSARAADVAVLPIGSFEQHGPCLPMVTDTVVACALSRRIAAAHQVLSLPPITVSCSHEHADWAGTVSISAATLYHMVRDIADSLRRSGIRSLVLVNGHGGNYVLRNAVQESAGWGVRMALFPESADWKAAREAAGIAASAHDDMHAGEIETSILLHTHPELLRPGHESTDRSAGDRRHLLTLGMREYTATGVLGRPSQATAEKGAALLDSLTESFGAYHTLLRGLDAQDGDGS